MPLCLPPLCIYPSPFPLPAVRESGRCCRRCRCRCRCCGRQCPPPLHAHQDALLPRLRCRPSHTVRDAATPCKADKSYMIGTGEEGAGSLRRGTAEDGTTTDLFFPDARTNGRTSCHRSQIYAGERQVPCRSKDIFGTQDGATRRAGGSTPPRQLRGAGFLGSDFIGHVVGRPCPCRGFEDR